jgi:hypothetical protein
MSILMILHESDKIISAVCLVTILRTDMLRS